MSEFERGQPERMRRWTWSRFHTYIKLKEGTDPAELEKKMADMEMRHNPNVERRFAPKLMAIDKVHLHAYDHMNALTLTLPSRQTSPGHLDISQPPKWPLSYPKSPLPATFLKNSRNRSEMKTTKELSYGRAVETGVVLGVALILLQLVNLMVYFQTTPGAEMAFTSAYMKSGGFYVFQVLGYFLYATVIYISIKKIRSNMVNKVLILIGSGVLLELSFYLIMQANFEGAFLYSILDKLVAAAFALILYSYTTPEVKTPESYI